MPLYLIAAPVEPVVTLDDLKGHLNVDFNDDDGLIASYGKAVTQFIDGRDGFLGRALLAQTWELRLDDFCRSIRIPLPPLIEVSWVKYFDTEDVQQTVPPSVYEVVGIAGSQPAEITLAYGQAWPSISARREAVSIQFRAGYASDDVPEPIKQAIKLWVGTLYMQRETINIGSSVNDVPLDADALLSPYQVPFFG